MVEDRFAKRFFMCKDESQQKSQKQLNNKLFPLLISLCRNGREARNRAEKHRRDKLNGSIQELSTMVPHVAESPRRVDKTAVLRFSAHGLRIDYGEFTLQPLSSTK